MDLAEMKLFRETWLMTSRNYCSFKWIVELILYTNCS